MVCCVPGCQAPSHTIFPCGLCGEHLRVEAMASAQADWNHGYELDLYHPHHALERERQARLKRERQSRETLAALARIDFGGADGTRYGVAALAGLIDDLISSPDGRNNSLNRAAFRAGQLVAAQELRFEPTVATLREAAEALGLPEREAKEVVRRSLRKGMENPRGAPQEAASPR